MNTVLLRMRGTSEALELSDIGLSAGGAAAGERWDYLQPWFMAWSIVLWSRNYELKWLVV